MQVDAAAYVGFFTNDTSLLCKTSRELISQKVTGSDKMN